MPVVNIHKAKTELSKLVDAVERGEVAEIIIARNGKPAARLVPLAPPPPGKRIGVAKGKFIVPDPDPALDAEIAALFLGEKPRRLRRKS
jgi:prevent-host-death family protein